MDNFSCLVAAQIDVLSAVEGDNLHKMNDNMANEINEAFRSNRVSNETSLKLNRLGNHLTE